MTRPPNAPAPRRPHASFWLDADRYERLRRKTGSADVKSVEYLMEMAGIRRGVANFVHIVTGRDIAVRFSSGKQSYSLSSGDSQLTRDAVVISATLDPERFDAMVGLALHEGSHLVWSKRTEEAESMPLFPFLTEFNKNSGGFVPAAVVEAGRVLGCQPSEVAGHLRWVMNVMEDRRIDRLQYERAPGYRPYYEAMYADIWQSEENDELMLSRGTRVPVVKNYLFHITNLTNANADPDALPGLRRIWEIVDLPNIRRFPSDPKWGTWQSAARFDAATCQVGYPVAALPDLFQAALAIIEIVYANSLAEMAQGHPEPGKTEIAVMIRGLLGDDGDGLPNLDIPDGPAVEIARETLKEIAPELDDVLGRMEKALEGETEKEELPEGVEGEMTTLEGSGARMKTGGQGLKLARKPKVVVYRSINDALLNSRSFPFTAKGYPGAVRDADTADAARRGTLLGDALVSRLRIMADESLTDFPRQTQGKLDRRRLASLGMGLDNVFHYSVVERRDPVAVHISLDSSSSMRGAKWQNTVAMAVAMARCAEKIRNLDVSISLRCADANLVHVLMLWDSAKDTFRTLRKYLPYLQAAGGTPEGLAFEAVREFILTQRGSWRKFFVNISDGEPHFHWSDGGYGSRRALYAGEEAWKHTARQVQEMRSDGIAVLSYFVGNRKPGPGDEAALAFRAMYGRDGAFIDPSSVTDIARTLNAMFLNSA